MLCPTQDRVFVRQLQDEKPSSAGIVIPSRTQDGVGVVIATGPGKEYSNGEVVAVSVKPGDRVLFNINAGQNTFVGREKILVMNEGDIFAILEDGDEA